MNSEVGMQNAEKLEGLEARRVRRWAKRKGQETGKKEDGGNGIGKTESEESEIMIGMFCLILRKI